MEELRKEKTIQEILGDKFLDNVRVFKRETLFEPNWDALKIDRCPICGKKLKFPRVRKIAYCSGKKHAKTFLINLDRLQRIKEIDYTKTYLPFRNM